MHWRNPLKSIHVNLVWRATCYDVGNDWRAFAGLIHACVCVYVCVCVCFPFPPPPPRCERYPPRVRFTGKKRFVLTKWPSLWICLPLFQDHYSQRNHYFQGQVSAEGILHLLNPNSTPNSGMRIFEPRILGPNSGVEFFGPMFSNEKSPLQKFTLKKFTARNSHQNNHPKIRAEKFTLHFCGAILLNGFDLFRENCTLQNELSLQLQPRFLTRIQLQDMSLLSDFNKSRQLQLHKSLVFEFQIQWFWKGW